MSDGYIDYWLNKGSAPIQNNDVKILDSKSYIQTMEIRHEM